ncbi:MAG: LacI family DNA-binding transcriptional regulator [Verrucomicrobia bacterium]|nr:LacI family DNA-binding transcriptional regulator [Verrucomicrobiota bacterium]
MKDVAELADVSITTVSHVLNKTRYVDRSLVRRVETAVKSLGYQPNALARGLRRNETRMLGMVVPDNSNPYFAELARSIEDACFECDYNVILCNSDEDPTKESAYLSLLAEKRVDGIVFVASGNDRSGVQAVLQQKIPMVILDRELKGTKCDSILVDNRVGACRATQHLLLGNHQRIGCVCGPKNLVSARERLQGYQDAFSGARLRVDPKWIQPGDFHIEGGYTAVQTLLDQPNRITAVFAANDLMAMGVLRGIAARDLRVPEDIAVVGFDGIALGRYTQPPLTTMAQPIREIGKLATELVLSRVNGERKEPRIHRLETTLVVRKSCGIPAQKRDGAKKST